MGGEEGKNLQKLGRGQERNPQVSSLRVFCCSHTLTRALQGSCMSMKSRGPGAAAGSSKGQGIAASGPAAGESVWLLPTVQLRASPWKVFKTTWSHVNKDSCLFPCLKSSWAQASSFFEGCETFCTPGWVSCAYWQGFLGQLAGFSKASGYGDSFLIQSWYVL